MAFHSYFSSETKNLVKLSNNDSLMQKMDKIYVGFNNYIKKEITETQFNEYMEELKIVKLDSNNNIVFEDNGFSQLNSSSAEVDAYNLLKQDYKQRQINEVKTIENFFNAGNSDTDWQTYLNTLKTINFEEDSIYPLTQGYQKYILSLPNMPRLSIHMLY